MVKNNLANYLRARFVMLLLCNHDTWTKSSKHIIVSRWHYEKNTKVYQSLPNWKEESHFKTILYSRTHLPVFLVNYNPCNTKRLLHISKHFIIC